jgi:hypothetical protein
VKAQSTLIQPKAAPDRPEPGSTRSAAAESGVTAEVKRLRHENEIILQDRDILNAYSGDVALGHSEIMSLVVPT